MKRFLAFFLTLIMILSLIACSKAEVNNETSTDTASDSSEKAVSDAALYIADLPGMDLKGREYRIATDNASLILPQNGTNYVGKKIYERNAAVEKKYNVKIVLTEESGLPSIGERIRMEALSGSDYCDLALVSATACQQLVLADSLQNVSSIPYLSTSGEGVFPDASSAFTLGNTVYGLCGDFCYSADGVYVVYFNKKLAEATGLPDLYQLVRDNQWDQENFQLYSEEAFSLGRINGQKIYGFTSSERAETLLQTFWAASDLKYVDNPYGGKPSLAYDSSAIRDGFINQSRKILYKSVAFLNNTSASEEAFRDGQVLFYIAPIGKVTNLSGAAADWGLLPMPVYDINQNSRRSYQDLDFQIVCFPKGIADIDFSGQVAQALFCASQGLSRDLALTQYVNLHLRSSEDGEMLKIVLQEPYFDPTEFFGSVYPEYISSTQTVIQRVVSSEGNYAQLYKQYSTMFEKFVQEKVS